MIDSHCLVFFALETETNIAILVPPIQLVKIDELCCLKLQLSY